MKLSEMMRCKHWMETDKPSYIKEVIAIWANGVAQLESALAAHRENEGDECPLCQLEADNEALLKRIKALEASVSKSVLRRLDAQLEEGR